MFLYERNSFQGRDIISTIITKITIKENPPHSVHLELRLKMMNVFFHKQENLFANLLLFVNLMQKKNIDTGI